LLVIFRDEEDEGETVIAARKARIRDIAVSASWIYETSSDTYLVRQLASIPECMLMALCAGCSPRCIKAAIPSKDPGFAGKAKRPISAIFRLCDGPLTS
jgi:hypothetical protein